METWRVIAAALLGLAGVPSGLIIMAKARERTDRASAAGIAGLVSFTALAVLCVLVLTVLPGGVAWGLVAAVAVAVGVLTLAS
ncbi:hypothetical protein ACFS2C_03770 [Prauserella oleivorans]|uniref:DUF4190 domain-containing protein n=1 Tax=Prauserella oleivorans TaxID=1478153 RepID=A0ABW5W3G4_9PSEU